MRARLASCAVAAIPWIVLGCGLDVRGTGAVAAGDAGLGPSVTDPGDGDDAAPSLPPPASTSDAGPAPIDASTTADAQPPDDAKHEPPPADAQSTALADATVDASVNAAACALGDPSCIEVPPGWLLVALSPTRERPCPSGFDQASADVVEGPNLASACACAACTIAADPDCSEGSVQILYASSSRAGPSQCSTQSNSIPIDPSGGCSPYPFPSAAVPATLDGVEYVPPAATGGTCSAPGEPQPNAIAYAAEERVCTAGAAQTDACSGGKACLAQVSPPYVACIMKAGPAAPCPPNSGFAVAHPIGTSVDFACTDCPCSVTATCSGTLELFGDDACQGLVATAPVDGSCQPFAIGGPGGGGGGGPGGGIPTYEYVPDPPNDVECATAETSMASESALEDEATICCAE